MEDSNLRLSVTNQEYQKYANEIYKGLFDSAKSLKSNICTFCTYNKKNNIFVRDHYHGSDFGKCYRAVQYSFISPKQKEFDPIKEIFLTDGHHNENVLVDLLSNNFLTHSRDKEFIIDKKVPISPNIIEEIMVVCHPDLIIQNGKQILVEFKSVKDWYYKNVALKGLLPKAYYGQVQIYLEATNLDCGLLFVKSRHTSEILPPFVIERDPKFIHYRFKYLATIQYLNKQKQLQLVPREYTNKTCSECKFCDYFKICWENQ